MTRCFCILIAVFQTLIHTLVYIFASYKSYVTQVAHKQFRRSFYKQHKTTVLQLQSASYPAGNYGIIESVVESKAWKKIMEIVGLSIADV